MAPGPEFYGFRVADVDPPARLVLEMRVDPFTGQEIPADAPGRAVHATWTFVLQPLGGSTRLIARSRAQIRLPFGVRTTYRLALGLIEFVMERRMLLGICERAERADWVLPGALREAA